MKLLNSNQPTESYKLVYENRVIGSCEEIKWNITNTLTGKILSSSYEVRLKSVTTSRTIPNMATITFDVVHTKKDGYRIYHNCLIQSVKNAIVKSEFELTFDTITACCSSITEVQP